MLGGNLNWYHVNDKLPFRWNRWKFEKYVGCRFVNLLSNQQYFGSQTSKIPCQFQIVLLKMIFVHPHRNP